MAVDIKVEVFSMDLFRNMWYKSKVVNFVAPRQKMFESEISEYSVEILNAVFCRLCLFWNTSMEFLRRDYNQFSSSGVDFYMYLRNTFRHNSNYLHLNVFDKMLTTCALVSKMGICCNERKNNMYLYQAPLCWAMFFDTELKEEFYDMGGWKELKKHSSKYNLVIFKGLFNTNDIHNAISLFFETFSDYNLLLLFDFFLKRCRHMKNSCTKCFPLFSAFKILTTPMEPMIQLVEIVEGILQIILRFISSHELETRKSNVVHDEQDESEHLNKILSENKISDSDCNVPQNRHGEELRENCEQDNKEIFRDIITLKLIDRLFVDAEVGEPNEKNKLDLCIFCCENVNEVCEPFPNLKQLNRVNFIKSIIYNTVDEMEFPKVDKFNVDTSKNEPVLPSKNDADMKSNWTSSVNFPVKTSVAEVDHSDTKDALMMFLALGVEPVRSHMLSVLKSNAVVGKSVKAQDAHDVLSNLINQEKSNSSKHKKKKLKKKISKDVKSV